jgi:thiamine biosynthesis protein ThiS
MKYEKKINIFVNGQKYQCSKSITLLNLLSYLNYQPSLLVIEYNKIICNSNDWKKVYLTMNDQIEIVTIVGGG